MKIGILGYKGFVGSAIYKHFSASGQYEVIGIGRDNYNSFIGHHFDVFINANGNSKKLLAAKEPQLDFEMNVKTTLATLFDFKIDKYVYISSVDVYNDVSNPANNHEDVTIQPEKLSNYGFDKYLGELVVKKYAQKWLILRLGGMVGEGLKKNPIYDMIYLKKLFVHPKSCFQFINTADVAKIIESLMEYEAKVFNLCGRGVVVLEEIAKHFSISLEDYGQKVEHYEVNTTNLEKIITVPETEETVFSFVNERLKV